MVKKLDAFMEKWMRRLEEISSKARYERNNKKCGEKKIIEKKRGKK